MGMAGFTVTETAVRWRSEFSDICSYEGGQNARIGYCEAVTYYLSLTYISMRHVDRPDF